MTFTVLGTRPLKSLFRVNAKEIKADVIENEKSKDGEALVSAIERAIFSGSWAHARDSQSVVSALIEQAHRLPDELLKSLTWDRGSEMAEHKRFTLATDAAVYFCDPQSPWQRGSNENTNRLLRQYFPKGTNLKVHSQERLDEIARQLNQRPRKTLGFTTPAERFDACVASTD